MKKEEQIEEIKDIHSEIRQPALKWLKKLQKDLAPKFLYKIAKEFKIDNESINDPLDWTDENFNRNYLQPFLETLPSGDLLLVAYLPVGILYTEDHDPNAFAIKPIDFDCCPVIALNWALVSYIDYVVPMVVEYSKVPKENRQESKQRIHDCIQDFINGFKLMRFIDKEYDEGVNLISYLIKAGVFAFIIAHEYGHILDGHLDPKDVTIKSEGFAKYNKNWKREYMADIYALHFAMSYLKDFKKLFSELNADSFTRACPLITMTLIACLESHLGFRPDKSTHPPAAIRRLRILLDLDSELSETEQELVDLFDWALQYNFLENLKKYEQYIE